MNVVFFGSAAFAVPALKALTNAHHVSLVVTQPDRPAGRGLGVREPVVKQAARPLGLSVIQPARTDDAIDELKAAAADVFVVAAYGQLLRREVYGIPPKGTINIHASLLPKYRGAAPIHWAILHGETTTGISTFFIEDGMDTGDILLQAEASIGPDETAGELHDRLAVLGAECILETLAGIHAGTLLPWPQPGDGVSYAPKMTHEHARIEWRRIARDVHNTVRGMNPWPGAYSFIDGDRVKVHRTKLTGIRVGDLAPGCLAVPETGRFLVATEDELIELVEVQRECRSSMTGEQCLRGLRAAQRFTDSPDTAP
ncbi:methionyl-tRNA formyltransferase [Candidatus Bipolaricaulota bacterium]|nr:methionyl-tRNA formyltransferase [Candidatus Bipolaricaulota bacterium]